MNNWLLSSLTRCWAGLTYRDGSPCSRLIMPSIIKKAVIKTWCIHNFRFRCIAKLIGLLCGSWINRSSKSYRSFASRSPKGKPSIYFTGKPFWDFNPLTQKIFGWRIDLIGVHWVLKVLPTHGGLWLYYYHKVLRSRWANWLAQKPNSNSHEPVNGKLTHLMLVSFYQANKERFKIITEARLSHPINMHLNHQNWNGAGWIRRKQSAEISPREGEFTLHTEDIIETIHKHGQQTSSVFGGVQYYTGQFFDIKNNSGAHAVGAYAGFDLAHAIGNVPLICTAATLTLRSGAVTNYLNSAGQEGRSVCRYEKHHSIAKSAFSGWAHEGERFLREKAVKPMEGIDASQLWNFPVLIGSSALGLVTNLVLKGMNRLRKKSELLTGYLEFLLNRISPPELILHQSHHRMKERGCNFLFHVQKRNGKKVFSRLTKVGIVADWREPNVIRVAPVPLYNSFEEGSNGLLRFCQTYLKQKWNWWFAMITRIIRSCRSIGAFLIKRTKSQHQ